MIDEEVEFLPIISVEQELESGKHDFADELPLLALRNTVLFPGVVIPITVGRDKSIKAVMEAYGKDKILAVVSQKDVNLEEPGPADMNKVGAAARIIKMLKMPDGSTTIIIQGKRRIVIENITSEDPFFVATISVPKE